MFDPVEAELVGRAIGSTLTGDEAAGDQEESGASFKGDDAGVGGGVGEQTEGEPGGIEFLDASAVAEEPGNVTGVGVAEGAEYLVIAGDEGGAGTNSAGGIDQATIEEVVEFRHGIGFVDVGTGEELASGVAEDLLSSDEEMAVVLTASSDVEEADENALRADADGVVEITGDAFAGKDGGDVGSLDYREDGRSRLNDDGRSGITRPEQGTHTQ